MNDYISVIGAINDNDLACLKNISLMHGLAVHHMTYPSETGIIINNDLPLAFISYMPSDPQSVLELFKILPIGTGEQIPLFQHLTSEVVDSYCMTLPIQGFFESPLTDAVVHTIIQAVLRNKLLLSKNQTLTSEIARCRNQKHQLAMIGTSLTKENNLENLLKIILAVAREMVNADAGSIYVRERVTPGGAYTSYLTFKVTQNDSVDVGSFNEFRLPIDDNSIAGYVAKTARALNTEDVDHLGTIPCHFDRGWEKKIGYHTYSMLTLPLKNIQGEVVGVLQLINRKSDTLHKSETGEHTGSIGAFSFSDEEFVQSIASQAAVSIERAHYHECINALFEGFLSSSIAAIDERDKVTSGHSRRVMGYATAFADAVANDTQGRYASLVCTQERIRQFQYAALLHDIGKIGVPESLLTKEMRLDPGEWSNLCMRFKYIELQLQTDPEHVSWQSAEELQQDIDFLDTVNKTGNCDDTMYERLLKIKKKTWTFAASAPIGIFTNVEWNKLSVRKGNLTDEERNSMNSHAVSTHRILSKIPWTKSLEQVPLIAAQHHEKCDGSGYPGGLTGDEILLESKILAVIDIYEALVAQDRPYKPKLPADKALTILRNEAYQGFLDKDVVEFFIEKKIYEMYMMKGEF